jgi:hypothetical protein
MPHVLVVEMGERLEDTEHQQLQAGIGHAVVRDPVEEIATAPQQKHNYRTVRGVCRM